MAKEIKLDKNLWAITGAIWWGIPILLLGLLGTFFSYGLPMITVLSSVYLGYAPTIKGSLIGTLWAMVDMYIGVWLFIWCYERVSKYFS